MSLLLKIVGSTLLFGFFASAANAAGTALVVLEPIFWIFRSDLTAIAVTFGLPAVAILVVLDFRNRVFNPLKNDIDYANKVFSGASDPQSYAEIDSEVDQSLEFWKNYIVSLTKKSPIAFTTGLWNLFS